jgi:hypothetical protein
MTGTVDSDPEDDGFSEKDICIRTVLKICQKHVGSGYHEHYSKVVKAFLSEAMELMEFLSKITSANATLRSLQDTGTEEQGKDQYFLRIFYKFES